MEFSLLATQGRLRKKNKINSCIEISCDYSAQVSRIMEDDVGGKLSQWSSVGKVNKKLQWWNGLLCKLQIEFFAGDGVA